MRWISITERVPENRREVFVWGYHAIFGVAKKPQYLGTSRFNPSINKRSPGIFDCEIVMGTRCLPVRTVVTDWAEIIGPKEPSSKSKLVLLRNVTTTNETE